MRSTTDASIPPSLYSHFAWQFGSSIFVLILGFVYGVLIAKDLGSADYGMWALGLSIATLSLRFFEATIYEALVNYLSKFIASNDSQKIFATVRAGVFTECFISALGVLLLGLASPLLSGIFAAGYDATLIIILSGFVVAFGKTPTYTAYATLRVLDDFRSSAILRMFGQVSVVLAVVIALYWFKLKIVGILLVELLVRGVTSIAFVITMYRRLVAKFGRPTEDSLVAIKPHLMDMWSYVKNSYLSSIVLAPTKELDVIILALFATPSSVGIYQLAKRFMIALEIASDSVVSVIFPEITRKWCEGKFQELGRFLRQLSLVLLATSVVTVAVTYFVFPYLVEYLLGREFLGVSALLFIMSTTIMLRLPLEWTSPLAIAAEKPNLIFRGALISGISTIALYLIVIPIAGTYGAAFTYAISTPLLLGTLFLFLLRAGVLKRLI